MPRRTPEIIDFREEATPTVMAINSVETSITTQTEEVNSRQDTGNFTNAKILRGQEAEIFDQEIDDADVEE